MSLSSAANEPLEVFAERAGRALACVFSSSDEFEAALIAERRAEGRYGRRRISNSILIVVAAITAALVALALFIV
jgi:hypothetical protein